MTAARNTFTVVRQPDGSWTAHPQPPLAATTTFVTAGWPEIARLRQSLGAVDHFPSSVDHAAFVQEFGPPPDDTRT